MNKLQSVIIKSAVGYFSNYINSDKNPVIEPLTCMIRLAILSFKPLGTKVCIYENSVYIQEPSILQGPIRWISGDNRNDIHYLLDPINKSLKKYDITDPSIENIFKLSVKGLKKLKKSYDKYYHTNSSLTSHSIDLYISKIELLLYNKVKLNNEEKKDNTNIIWNNEQINIINYLFIQCQTNYYECESYLKAIENILNSKIKTNKEILVHNMNNSL